MNLYINALKREIYSKVSRKFLWKKKKNKKYRDIKRYLYIKIQKYIKKHIKRYTYTLRNAYNIIIRIYYVKNYKLKFAFIY